MPYLILFNNTGSQAFSVILNVVLPLLVYAGNITALATCARWMRAFARDRGLPFSKWIGHMNAKWQIPFKAAYATPAGCLVLALIHLGSALTLNIIVSLSMVGLMSTYMLSIGCVFLKRVRGEKVPARSVKSMQLWHLDQRLRTIILGFPAHLLQLSNLPQSLPRRQIGEPLCGFW